MGAVRRVGEEEEGHGAEDKGWESGATAAHRYRCRAGTRVSCVRGARKGAPKRRIAPTRRVAPTQREAAAAATLLTVGDRRLAVKLE